MPYPSKDYIPIPQGTTAGQIKLSRHRTSGVFVLDLCGHTGTNPENRWTLPFATAVHKAFDATEILLLADPPKSKAAFVTLSTAPKFFSNGIDVDWMRNPHTPTNSLREWDDLTMPAFARPILLGCPTICAIGGHAFGAGLMFALGHDYRLQRTKKGYLCAVEIAIGVATPAPEITLFKHAMPSDAFYSTVLEAKRWSAEAAVAKGVIQRAVPMEELVGEALKEAEKLANLTCAGVVGYTKFVTKGYVAQEILEYTFPGGKKQGARSLPKGLARLVEKMVVQKKKPLSARVKGASSSM